jgi:class 3 adenylate cyclase/tetratricopeptide (TPR) repeat protein
VAEARKTVTVVFSDVVGSTSLGESLDPEAVRRVMERYFAEARAAFERHGGTVEKFIGDAVMAVFGIPAAHEDDALRAVRAAQDMQQAIARLNADLERERGVTLGVRTGINTGEVVAGDPSGGHFYATGDAVNVAARLEQTAAPGEIVLGEKTYQLVRGMLEVEAVEQLRLKGKAEAVAAYRLLGVVERAPAFTRRFDIPFVGRRNELARLLECFERSVTDRAPTLVTVLGSAGIGKTRLAGELVGEVAEGATVLQGRCLSYGEGITFWPLQEILRSLPMRPAGAPDPEEAQSTEEIFWAYRKLFEALGRERPLLLVLEDIHWAEPTLLDLIEHVVEWTREAPIAVVCLARPELLDDRPGWSGERLELEPLAEGEAKTLVEALAAGLDPSLRTRALEVAEGNPLFLEQLLALAGEDGSELVVPPTIRALLAARLDRLDSEERALLERAAIVGKEFWRGALLALSPPATEVSPLLQRLIRKRLILPERSSWVGEDAFCFGHILMRDATYSGIPKEARASLHERFADWLEEGGSPYQEILGYHLEQAYLYRTELGPIDDGAGQLATRAGLKLGAAGQRAFQHGDSAAAANLLDRAARLLPPNRPERLDTLLALGSVLTPLGEPAKARTVLTEAIDAARTMDDRGREWRAQLERSQCRAQFFEPASSATRDEDLHREAQQATSAFEELGDEQGLARAWRAQGQALYWMGHFDAALAAAERALYFAERIGDVQEGAQARGLVVASLVDGTTPVPKAIRRCEEILASAEIRPHSAAHTRRKLSMLYSMQGEVGAARRLIDEAVEAFEELGLPLPLAAALGFESATAHWIEGDLAAAEGDVRRAVDLLTAMNERGVLSTVAARLADILCRQDRQQGEVEDLLRLSEDLAGADDWLTHLTIKHVRARLLARQGEFAEAVSLAREALALAEGTDEPESQAWERVELAEILVLAGRPDEAEPLLEAAIDLFEAKGHTFGAEEAQQTLANLRARLSSSSQ